MDAPPLPAQSMAEAALYLMAASCPRCSRGPFHRDQPPIQLASSDGKTDRVAFQVTCASCQHTDTFAFEIPATAPAASAVNDSGRINSSSHPSRILDVGQWLTLFKMILESASREPDRRKSRRLGYEAAQCLEEALKFYEVENDLPPPSACFLDSTRQRLRERPDLFARQRLIELRGKLPTLAEMERQVKRDHRKNKWWRFWR